MAIEEILEDMAFEEAYGKYQAEWQKKHQIAVKHGWNFTNFEKFISQFLKYTPSEDMWIFCYEIYVDTLKPDFYEHPASWAEFFYQKDWDTEKANKSLESLKRITK